MKRFVCALLSSAPFIMAAAFSPAGAKTLKPGDDFQPGTVKEAGANGGVWKSEIDEHWKRGPITQIDVCHGGRVDSIQVYYAGIAGTKFGGHGGQCEEFVVNAGDFISTVRVWSGAGLDAIQFVTDQGVVSDRFGGGGGIRKLVQDPNKGAIRKIDVKVGDYVDRLKFTYGLPYYIGDIEYKLDKKALGAAKPQYTLYPGVKSCDRGSQSTSVKVSETKSSTHSWDFGWSLTVGFASEFSAGVPDVSQATVSFSTEATVQGSESKSYTTDKTIEQDVPVTAKEGEIVDVVARTSIQELNMPFTYNLIYYRGEKDNVVDRRKFDGVYKGVLVGKFEVDKQVKMCPGREAAAPPKPADKPPADEGAETPNSHATAPKPPSGADEDDGNDPIAIDNAVAQLNGTSFNCVYASNGSSETAFRLGDDGLWREETVDTGEARFTFTELDRSDGEILLLDINRNVLIGIDLNRGKITYAANEESDFMDIYDITGTEIE